MSATYLIDLQSGNVQSNIPRLIEEHILGTNYTNLLHSQLNAMGNPLSRTKTRQNAV